MTEKRNLSERVARAAEAALAERRYAGAVDVLIGLGWLAPTAVDAWRQGRLPDLERVTQRCGAVSRTAPSWPEAGCGSRPASRWSRRPMPSFTPCVTSWRRSCPPERGRSATTGAHRRSGSRSRQVRARAPPASLGTTGSRPVMAEPAGRLRRCMDPDSGDGLITTSGTVAA